MRAVARVPVVVFLSLVAACSARQRGDSTPGDGDDSVPGDGATPVVDARPNPPAADVADGPTPAADAPVSGNDTSTPIGDAAILDGAPRDTAVAVPDAGKPDGPANPGGTVNDLVRRQFTSPTTKMTMPYRLFIPRAYDPQVKYAVVLFLHGAGEWGSDNQTQLRYGVAALVSSATQGRRQAFVIAPQSPAGAQWVNTPWPNGSYSITKVPISKPLTTALEILAAIRKEFNIDPDRVLVTGLSMGGYGCWDTILRNPTLFAAAVPVCGAGDPTKAALIKDMPLWIYHGDADPTVPVSGSRQMVSALKAAGGHPFYDEIKGLGHNAWDVAYKDQTALNAFITSTRAGK